MAHDVYIDNIFLRILNFSVYIVACVITFLFLIKTITVNINILFMLYLIFIYVKMPHSNG